MRPAKAKIKRFRLETRYPHLRSDGLTRRTNGGTRQLIRDRVPKKDKERRAGGG